MRVYVSAGDEHLYNIDVSDKGLEAAACFVVETIIEPARASADAPSLGMGLLVLAVIADERVRRDQVAMAHLN